MVPAVAGRFTDCCDGMPKRVISRDFLLLSLLGWSSGGLATSMTSDFDSRSEGAIGRLLACSLADPYHVGVTHAQYLSTKS